MFPQIDLENDEMTNAAITWLGNLVTRASDLAKTVKELTARLDKMELDVAAAKHGKEIADAAYDQVNAQRIEAENALTRVRTEQAFCETENAVLLKEVRELREATKGLEAEITKIKESHQGEIKTLSDALTAATERAKDHEDLYKLAEQDKAQLQEDLEKTNAELRIAHATVATQDETIKKLRDIIDNINKAIGNAKNHWESQPRDEVGKWIAPRVDLSDEDEGDFSNLSL
jgi:chromosome segregation ATPase